MSSLDKDLWQAVSPLLDRALDLPIAARARMLEQVAAERPDLAKVLADLLEDHDQLLESHFLGSPPSPLASTPSAAGQTVGAYTLDSPLGMGGMGTVWLAHRSDGRFEGSVAVKLLNLALLERGGDGRFKREGTLLARLAHPNIARLLDAGVSTAGQPYLVLEYIEGLRIDEFADQSRLDAPRRLELFVQVAQAVAYAHASLIVHRDLKPSNILVDANGQVKLLDFGIARLLEREDVSGGADVTLPGGQALTPEYAAPEQTRGDLLTTATDVYALGVLLYRLLTGRHPTGADCATPAEYLYALLENEPVRASDAVLAPAEQPGDVLKRARRRASTPERLHRLYRGAIDHILAKALRKEPADRYASVTAFAEDVRRYLNDEPVSVKADTWRYRAARSVRRHKAGVGAAAAIAAVLLAATGVSAYLMVDARRQRDEARFQARRAEASSEFMRYLVTQIGSTPMTMKEVLDRGRVSLERQYGGDPAFVGRMLVGLSGPYIELGDYTTAAAMMNRALEIAVKTDDADLLATTHCDTGDDAVERRDFAAAHAHIDEGLRQARRLKTPAVGALVGCAVSETRLATAEGRFEDAIGHATRAVGLLEASGITSTTQYTSALNNLGVAYFGAGRYRDAARTQRQVTNVSNQIGHGHTIGVVASLSNEANAERLLGWWLAAERTDREAIEILHGLDASGGLPTYMALNYGRVLIVLGRPAEGAPLLERVVAQTDASPRFVAAARLALTTLLLDQGDVSGARASFTHVHLGSTPSATDRAGAALVRVRLAAAEGGPGEARKALADALRGEGYPARPSTAAYQLLDYGSRLAIDAGDREEAVRLARDEVAVCERDMGTAEPSAYTGRAHVTLGLALLAGGRTAEARAEIAWGETLEAEAAGADHPWVRDARSKLAQLTPATPEH